MLAPNGHLICIINIILKNSVYPCVPGHEILGVIEKIGANV